jgi:hypothetical protein
LRKDNKGREEEKKEKISIKNKIYK